MVNVRKSADGQVRDQVIQVRVSAAEKAVVAGHAAAAGLAISEYVLSRALTAGEPVLTGEQRQLLQRCERQLQAAGNNLNQLTRDMNSAALGVGAMEPVTRERIASVVAEVAVMVDEMTAARLPVRQWLARRDGAVG